MIDRKNLMIDDWVPLTPEILEKNGFVPIENNSGYNTVVFGTTMIEFHTGWPDEKMAIRLNWNKDSGDIYDADFILPNPKYVHELQHDLRLCGINKTIKL